MDLLETLHTTKAQTLEYFDLPNTELDKVYAPGKWSVRQLLHHLADAETVLYDRLRRIISEPRGVVWAFNQDDWNEGLEYKTMPLHLNKKVFEAVRNSVIYLAEKYYVSLGHKEFIHNQTGLRTLKDEFEKVGWHCEHHLKQIEIALRNQGSLTNSVVN